MKKSDSVLLIIGAVDSVQKLQTCFVSVQKSLNSLVQTLVQKAKIKVFFNSEVKR
jgi:hypothetical protein